MLRMTLSLLKPFYLRSRYVGSRWIDRTYGITTTDEHVARALGWDIDHYRRTFRAMPFAGAMRLVRRLNPEPTDVLLDLGCGAGRLICVAAQYPVARIIGVELDDGLSALAQQNARSLRRYRTQPEVVHADATRFHVPDEVSIVFIYNSFGGEVLRAALARIIESFDRAPRRIRIAYANPRQHDLLMSTGRMRDAGLLRMSWRPGAEWDRTQIVRFYTVVPPASLADARKRADGQGVAAVASR
ncbi:MAG TPA: class I SAM-dependent methyltransferase [Azospirillaceae bacterium]|nr:class I SAM-dependent methyltransferase [Azospirillaceae bacterium]